MDPHPVANECSRKHVLVTGAGSGIGKATAQRFAQSGFHVFAGYHSLPSGPVPPAGGITAVKLDVTSAADIDVVRSELTDHVGGTGLDAVCNIAGVGAPAPLEAVSIEVVRGVFEVNVFGTLALTQAVLPLLTCAHGRIITVGSIGDRLAVPYMGTVTSSKAATRFVNDTLRLELASSGVKAILVEPASIHTEAVDKAERDVEKEVDRLRAAGRNDLADEFASAMDHFLEGERNGSRPETVAETILQAATARSPHRHYLVGRDSRKLALLARLPDAMADALKLRMIRK